MNKSPKTDAIMPASDVSSQMAPIMPVTEPIAPMRQLRKSRAPIVLVQREAVMAGIIMKAMTKIEPMVWNEVTAVRETRLISP